MTDPSPELPPTPPPQLRAFERLANAASELSLGCWGWILVAIGAPVWPVVGGLLAMLAAVAAWWRFIALRAINGSVSGSGPAAWMGMSAVSGIAGTAFGSLSCLRGLGIDLPMPEWPWPLWTAITAFELAAAIVWVLRGSLERGSTWMALPMGLAATLLLAVIGAHAISVSIDDAPRVVRVLLLGAVVVGGAAGPLLIADGAARLTLSLCSESLDEESEAAASPRSVGPRD